MIRNREAIRNAVAEILRHEFSAGYELGVPADRILNEVLAPALAARDAEIRQLREHDGPWVARQIAREAALLADKVTDPAAQQAYRTMEKAAADYAG